MEVSERQLNLCKKCNSRHEGNGEICGICLEKKIVKLQEDLAWAVKLLFECYPIIFRNKDDFTSTQPDIKTFIRKYQAIEKN